MDEKKLLIELGTQIAALQTVVIVLMSEHPDPEKLAHRIRAALSTQADATRETAFQSGTPVSALSVTDPRWHHHVERLLLLAKNQRGTPEGPA